MDHCKKITYGFYSLYRWLIGRYGNKIIRPKRQQKFHITSFCTDLLLFPNFIYRRYII